MANPRKKERKKERQTDRKKEREKDRKTERQKERQTERQVWYVLNCFGMIKSYKLYGWMDWIGRILLRQIVLSEHLWC